MSNVDNVQIVHDLMCNAWKLRPSDCATHFCPVHKAYYCVNLHISDTDLFIWCSVNFEWLEVEPSMRNAVMARIQCFEPEHKTASEIVSMSPIKGC